MDEKEISIILNVSQWNGILAVLGQRPFAEVASIIEDIRRQAESQLSAQAETPSE